MGGRHNCEEDLQIATQVQKRWLCKDAAQQTPPLLHCQTSNIVLHISLKQKSNVYLVQVCKRLFNSHKSPRCAFSSFIIIVRVHHLNHAFVDPLSTRPAKKEIVTITENYEHKQNRLTHSTPHNHSCCLLFQERPPFSSSSSPRSQQRQQQE